MSDDRPRQYRVTDGIPLAPTAPEIGVDAEPRRPEETTSDSLPPRPPAPMRRVHRTDGDWWEEI